MQGTSGRTLRRLPLLAHARYSAKTRPIYSYEEREPDEDEEDLDDLGSEYETSTLGEDLDTLETWLDAMMEAVKAEQEQMAKVEEDSVYL